MSESSLAPVGIGQRGIAVHSIEELSRVANMIHRSGWAPKGMGVEAIAVAIQMGMEVGLSPISALRNISVINGRPSWMGKAALAIVKKSGLLEAHSDRQVGPEPDKSKGLKGFQDKFGVEITLKRAGEQAKKFAYYVADAKIANLWGKTGPWSTAPINMLYWRALGGGLDKVFPDVVEGLTIAEIAQDIPAEKGFEQARDVTPAAATPPPEKGDGFDALLESLESEEQGGQAPADPPPPEELVVEEEPSGAEAITPCKECGAQEWELFLPEESDGSDQPSERCVACGSVAT